jgi:hypothetical protein
MTTQLPEPSGENGTIEESWDPVKAGQGQDELLSKLQLKGEGLNPRRCVVMCGRGAQWRKGNAQAGCTET